MTIQVPLAYRPSPYLLNLEISISVNGDSGHYSLPIQFKLKENLGRIMFDGLHNQIIPDFDLEGGGDGLSGLNMELDSNSLSGGFSLSDFLSERLETLFGNYYSFHAAISNEPDNETKGIAMMQFIKGLNIESLFGGYFSDSMEGMEDSLIMDQIFRGENFFTFDDNFSSDYYSYDLIKFFDSVAFVNPEVKFNEEELESLEKYMSLGGNIYIFCENDSNSDPYVLNQLLALGNLSLGEQFNGTLEINETNFTSLYPELTNNVSSIKFNDPLKIVSTSNQSNIDYIIPDYLAQVVIGQGKMIAVGDHNFITELHIHSWDHYQFIQNLFQTTMNTRFQWDAGLVKDTIEYGEKGYVYVNLQNTELLPLLEDEFLGLVFCVDEYGNDVPVTLFGYESPILPLLQTNETALYAGIESTWIDKPINSSLPTELWISIIIDSTKALTETLSFKLIILGENKDNLWGEYEQPARHLPIWVEIVLISVILSIIIILWRYSFFRWRSRHRYITPDDSMQNKVKTNLSTLQLSIQQLYLGIQNNRLDEIEKIRFILGEEGKIKKNFKEIHELAEDLGEK
jgi:hypothetical protein